MEIYLQKTVKTVLFDSCILLRRQMFLAWESGHLKFSRYLVVKTIQQSLI